MAFADAHGSRGDRHSQKSTPELVAAGPEASGVSGLAGSHGRRDRRRRGRPLLRPRHPDPARARDPAELHARPGRRSGCAAVGLGRIPAVLAVVLLLFVALLGLGAIVANQVVHLADNLPRYEWNLRSKIRDLRIAIPSGGVVERTSDMLRDLGQELEEATDAGRERGQERRRRPRLPKPVPVQVQRAGGAAAADAARAGRAAGRADRDGGPGGGLRHLHAAPARGPA